MMITPISHYTTKRNKHGVECERNGRATRKTIKPAHVVYIMRPQGASRIKIGRTCNAKQRMVAYEGVSGVPVRFIAQFVVDTADDAKALEKIAIKAVAEKFRRFKREWFLCELDDVPAVIEIVGTAGADLIRSVRAVNQEPRTVPAFDRQMYGMTQAMRGHLKRNAVW